MMRKFDKELLVAFLTGIAIILVALLWPNESFSEPTERSKPIQCAEPEEIFEFYVERADLKVEFIAVAQVKTQQGDVTPQAVVFFYNKESGKWLFIEGDKDYACVIGVGEKFDSNVDHDTIISLFTGKIKT